MKKMSEIALVWAVLLLFGSQALHAKLDETQFRQSVSFSYKPIKALSLDATYRLDLHDNLRQYGKSNFDFSASYDIQKWIKVMTSYRYINSLNKDKHRLGLGLAFSVKPSDKKYQFQFRTLFNFDSDFLDRDYWKMEDPTYKLRLRTKFKYKVSKKLDVSSTVETYMQNLSSGYNFYRMRYGVGVDYDVHKSHSIGASYFYQHEFNVKRPDNIQVFSLAYTYKIKHKKKKK